MDSILNYADMIMHKYSDLTEFYHHFSSAWTGLGGQRKKEYNLRHWHEPPGTDIWLEKLIIMECKLIKLRRGKEPERNVVIHCIIQKH